MTMTDQQKYAALNRALSQFWFVGSYIDCDRLIAAISRDLGLPATARRRNTAAEWVKRVNWQPKKAAELSPATHEEILANNPLDQALWQSWAHAGFDPAGVRPQPLESSRQSFFLTHEAARPIFAGVCRYQRDWAPQFHPGGARNSVGPKILRAERAQESRRWELAVRYYRSALADMPNAPEMWVQYGHALKESGNVSEAEAAYRKSINLDPDSADAYLQLGHALKIQGRIDEAVSS